MPSTSRLSRYQVLSRLGGGAFGFVELARDRHTGAQVALKTSYLPLETDEDRVRFEREAKIPTQVSHPQIIQVIEAWIGEDQRARIVFEYLEGENLEELFLEGALPSVPTLGRWYLDLAEALDLLHASGLIHRDIKPSNLLAVPGRGPVLADFGLGRSLTPGTTITLDGVLMGTPAYMAPRLFQGERAGPETDHWALAASFQELFTGSPPYQGVDPSKEFRRARKLLETRLPLPPEVAEPVRARIEAALGDPSRASSKAGPSSKDPRRGTSKAPKPGRSLGNSPLGLVFALGFAFAWGWSSSRFETNPALPSAAVPSPEALPPEPPKAQALTALERSRIRLARLYGVPRVELPPDFQRFLDHFIPWKQTLRQKTSSERLALLTHPKLRQALETFQANLLQAFHTTQSTPIQPEEDRILEAGLECYSFVYHALEKEIADRGQHIFDAVARDPEALSEARFRFGVLGERLDRFLEAQDLNQISRVEAPVALVRLAMFRDLRLSQKVAVCHRALKTLDLESKLDPAPRIRSLGEMLGKLLAYHRKSVPFPLLSGWIDDAHPLWMRIAGKGQLYWSGNVKYFEVLVQLAAAPGGPPGLGQKLEESIQKLEACPEPGILLEDNPTRIDEAFRRLPAPPEVREGWLRRWKAIQLRLGLRLPADPKAN